MQTAMEGRELLLERGSSGWNFGLILFEEYSLPSTPFGLISRLYIRIDLIGYE